MAPAKRLRVVLVKPSKYTPTGEVERFRRGFMPNCTLPYMAALTPRERGGCVLEVYTVDEYVHTDLRYLSLLDGADVDRVLVGLVGVQSHQFHRALDLAAYAAERGALVVLGGPHVMTCDTADHEGRGVSFAVAEAEICWNAILDDAIHQGELAPRYGDGARWSETLDPPPVAPPSRRDLARYAIPVLGVYPARGCPFTCNFCSVIQIAGRRVRSQPVETTLATLRSLRPAGVRYVFFSSDNFNKYAGAEQLLDAMIEERLELPFFAQCDTQVVRQPDFVAKLARAGCFQMFVGVESLSREALVHARKSHNQPARYAELLRLCRENGITAHFSTILGFPEDTHESLADQLEAFCALGPEVASFWILTPIPGTEQYADFRRRGLVTEPNLDRYDAICPTWRHPNLSAAELGTWLSAYHRRFYRAADVLRKTLGSFTRVRDFRRHSLLWAVPGFSTICRWGQIRRPFPTVGGMGLVAADRASDYLPLRRRRFACELAPLPANRQPFAAVVPPGDMHGSKGH